ncbi:ROK family protein [Lacisediminihabitans profunda]|uniref:ROK family protein n=1 Tax=Lacisediminihabitans profunda TaxID=2594790 RepID=A0A5C8UXT9_9MICO|nr:ROK family protein [Lacisediminihabitans profunda]TXN32489.1 ROK family protein [Lacisediminihabitans profunda]
MISSAVLGIDVGGTSIKARLADAAGITCGEWREPTPIGDSSGERTAAVIRGMLEVARGERAVEAVGLVVPGIVDERSGVCIRAVNLGWLDVPVRDIVQSHIDVPLAFGQDVRAGALAECLTGAAAGVAGTVAFIPIGTGLASALIVEGFVMSSGGWAGEIGQVVISSGPHTGHRVEEIASAGGMAQRAGEASALAVAELVLRGDARATSIWNDGVAVLAEAMAWIFAVAAPDMFVLGGGLTEAGGLLLDPLEREFAARLPPTRPPVIARAVHGDAAAMIGATYLARRLLAAGDLP